jgi:hypothetical protein
MQNHSGKQAFFHSAEKNTHRHERARAVRRFAARHRIKRNFAPKYFFEKCAKDFGE